MRLNRSIAFVSTLVLFLVGRSPQTLHAGIITRLSVPDPFRLPDGVPQIERITERFKDGDYEGCLAILKDAAASHPELPPGRLMFAKLCLMMDQSAKGREALELAAVENPDVPETYIVFGRLALQDNRLTDAQLQFDKAIGLAASGSWSDPMRQGFLAEAYSGLAGVAEKRKDWPAAATSLAAWLKLEPKSGQARGRLAEILFRQGEHARAQGELEQAVSHDPTLEPAAILMARLFTEEGNLAKAGEWMEYAVRVAPDNAKTHLGYAAWLVDRGRNKQAKTEAETAARIDPASQEAKSLIGVIAWQLKEYQVAERTLQELHVENPGNFSVSDLWARCLAELPSDAQRMRAWQVAQINAKLYPSSAEALTTLGWIAYRRGQVNQAEQSLRAALASGNASSETAYYLARVLADRQQAEEARQLLKISLDAGGRFSFRDEAQTLLDRLQATSKANAPKTKPN